MLAGWNIGLWYLLTHSLSGFVVGYLAWRYSCRISAAATGTCHVVPEQEFRLPPSGFFERPCRQCRAHLENHNDMISLIPAFFMALAMVVTGNPDLYQSPVQSYAASTMVMTLGALAIVDLRHGLLPDFITWPALLFGLCLSAVNLGLTSAQDSILGASLGWVVFAGVGAISRHFGQDFGAGDAKVIALLGAWLGTAGLVLALVFIFAISVMLMMANGGRFKTLRYGPVLALSSLFSLGALSFIQSFVPQSLFH